MPQSLVAIPTDSPLYPLPADYSSLTAQGQRAARVNACRQWLVPSLSDQERGVVFNLCVVFFDHTYLRESDEGYHPMFYELPPVADAPFFSYARQCVAEYKANLIVFPRGYAKSTIAEQCTLLRSISCPLYSTVYITNIFLNAKKRGGRLRFQCYNNELIQRDWGPEYGGSLKPPRGEMPSGIDHFVLTNGSEILVRSVGSELRGLRVRRALVDDPEADEAASTSMTTRVEELDTVINSLVVPMVLRPGCGVDWLATFISKKHLAWKAMQTRKVGNVHVARDIRFQEWNRIFVPAAYTTPEGLHSTWPALYPATEADIQADPALKGATSLEKTRRIMGDRRFFAEYMGRPADSGASFMPAFTPERHGWWLKNVDDIYHTNPRASEALICYNDPSSGEPIETPLKKFFQSVALFMHCDYAYTHHSNSDFKATGLFAFLRGPGIRFCLDLWAERCPPTRFTKAILQMADRWRCPQVYVEAIREGYTLYDDLRSVISTRIARNFGITHYPRIHKQPRTMAAKTDRIAALSPILDNNLFKFPLFLEQRSPWSMLFQQFREFTPEAKDGGLENDDCIDLCAMTRDVISGAIPRTLPTDPTEPQDALAHILDGKLTDEHGSPYALGLDLSKIPASVLQDFIHERASRAAPRRSRV